MKVNTHTALCDITCQKNIKQINEIAFDFYDSLVSLKLLDCKNALELTPVRYKGKQCLKTVNSFPMKWGKMARSFLFLYHLFSISFSTVHCISFKYFSKLFELVFGSCINAYLCISSMFC